MMGEYRVTKYNPSLRGRNGLYLAEDWTSVCDVGSRVSGRLVELSEYLKVEDAYLESLRGALRAGEPGELRLSDIEYPSSPQPSGLPTLDLSFLDDAQSSLSAEHFFVFARAALRELVWARVEGDNQWYVYFGYEYYMYIGGSLVQASDLRVDGLYVEAFESPYGRDR